MIPFDFEYYKPASLDEAVNAFKELDKLGKHPIYYSGGTEIITRARRSRIYTEAVIDIKEIPECRAYGFERDNFITGAALTLTQIEEKNAFSLLTRASRGVADHTARNSITLGGNICGEIRYREAVLPFLICDSLIVTIGRSGMKRIPINTLFNKKLQLANGELLVYLITDKRYLNLPHSVVKRTRIEKSGYPLVTLAAVKVGENIRMTFSGVCEFPFRSLKLEEELNNKAIPLEERINRALKFLPAPIVDDILGSAEYRKFVLINTIIDVISMLEGERYEKI